MIRKICISLAFLCVATCWQLKELRMPGAEPQHGEQYLCTSMNVSTANPNYIVGFVPHASMHTVHHILLFGCASPGTRDDIWDCGEMESENGKKLFYEPGPVCSRGSQIVYAWARDAPQLKLPDGVGFMTGSGSQIRYLVMQVHYMHAMDQPDYSGLTIKSTSREMPRKASVLLMATGGMIKSHSSDNFETACVVDDKDVEVHPFAFRTHTHKRGRVVSGYVVDGETGEWKLIGKKNPMLPQMFYPVDNKNLVIKTNDILAARCTMVNEEDRDIYIGSTGNDEMCNFYMMYWVDNDRPLDSTTCFSPGPPDYYWKNQKVLKNIPDKDASSL
uniref:peptidylglycine monooxygenase n=1 Tax=Romanomermis culicivorax TaxID=13658 RepID=A0A915JKC0_ROMCU